MSTRTANHDVTVTNPHELLADAAMAIAVATAEAAHRASLTHLLTSAFPDADDDWRLVADSSHPGDAAAAVDAAADAAARSAHRRVTEDLDTLFANRISRHIYISEERSLGTTLVAPRTVITRVDPCDGTTNARNIMGAFCASATVDYVPGHGRPTEHLGGSIIGGEFDVKWMNTHSRNRTTGRYQRIGGDVHVRAVRLGPGWHRLHELRGDRSVGSAASVASNRKRLTAALGVRPLEADGNRFYNTAGNPLAAAMLIGEIDEAFETTWTKLHDSVFLIPFAMLGGEVRDSEGSPLNIVELYADHAGDLDTSKAVVPPYFASAPRM